MKRIIFIMLFCTISIVINANSYQLKFENKLLVIELVDHLKHPLFEWPSSLLSYPVQFDGVVKQEDLMLSCNGNEIPFQLSDVTYNEGIIKAAKLNFISDLPSGASRKFELSLRKGKNNFENVIKEEIKDNIIIISSDKLSVSIPLSGNYQEAVPGPVMQISQYGKERYGRSYILTGQRKALNVESTLMEKGDLFISYKVKYTFDNGGVYEAVIKVIAGYDFFEFGEKTSGLTHHDQVSFVFDWTGFSPTHRQAPNHPYTRPFIKDAGHTGINRYEWETIDQSLVTGHHGTSSINDADGLMLFQLGVFEPWPAGQTLSSAAFWDEHSNSAAGIFINKTEDWNDKLYSIWSSSDMLNVKYYYKDSLLKWKFPITDGTRSVAIVCYDHSLDAKLMDRMETEAEMYTSNTGNITMPMVGALAVHPYSYPTYLQSRFGAIRLDKIKDWALTYDKNAIMPPVVFNKGGITDAAQFEKSISFSDFIYGLATSGARQNNGLGPVPARKFYEDWIGSYNNLHSLFTDEQHERITALLLMSAYVCADEDLMPMKYMLSGHPNFLADVKSVPPLIAFLFPEHPESDNWLNLFEKYVDLNVRYHTRPDVTTWNAQGGRWTENLGTYVWGFLKVSLRTSALNEMFGMKEQKNRVASPNMAKIGSWLMESLSSPFNGEDINNYRNSSGVLTEHFWGIVTPEKAPQRLHPPQGAHSARRMPPRTLWLLGNSLRNYDPLLAEHLMWISKPTDQDTEDIKNERWNHVYPTENFNTGTLPDFKSNKYTGYGIVLRAAVNTPDELSVHLQQIDDGHNYRWGDAADNGSGTIYFYAGGKSYSHNGREDRGDRRSQDTDFGTGFGVFKDGAFRSIGMNVLERPMYDLGAGQFAEIVSDSANNNVWPEYVSRSIMMVGSDYFITYDDLLVDLISGRFSWYTHPKDDMPFIQLLRPDVPDDRVSTRKTELTTSESKGIWYDGGGDFMALVSHKNGISTTKTEYGAIVKIEDKTDYIFRNDKPLIYNENGLLFNGTAGFIRQKPEDMELVLFHGTEIGNSRLKIKVNHTDLGVAAKLEKDVTITGKYNAPKAGTMELELDTDSQHLNYLNIWTKTKMKKKLLRNMKPWQKN